MERTHHGQHGPDCFGCKLVSVQFGNVTPPPQRLMEHRWEKDRPAYKRMRDQGLQPRRIEGCAELETRANSQTEIDLHALVDPKVLRDNLPKINEGMAIAWESGWSPVSQVHENKGAA